MASNMLPFRPLAPPPSNSSGDRHKSSKWWSPLFGFSSEPDYINPGDMRSKPTEGESKTGRVGRGCFTEEKARQFRRLTCDASSFHETMYHSAIASRLASDFSDRIAD